MTGGPSPLWYATRATGVTALLLLTGTVVLGVVGVARLDSPRWPKLVTSALHRNTSLLAVTFVAVHVLTTVLDTYAPISWISVIVPFTSSYRTLWLGLGAVAFDLLLAVAVTSLLRVRLGYRVWRAVHWAGSACWPVALWHGLGTGTDTRLPWLLGLDAACVAAVAGALGWRLCLAGSRPGRLTAKLACVAVPLATAAFVAAGPLQPGWARRAGTPVALLAGSAASARAPSPATAAPAGGSFSGRAARTQASGLVTLTVWARMTAPTPQSLVITLRGTADGSGISMSSGTVSVAAGGASPGYQGPVVRLDGDRLVAELRGPGGSVVRARITLVIRGPEATGRLAVATGEGQ